MWGFGVGNNHTVPSFFSELTGESSANFGEWSWQSRQSVNQLLTLIADGERPSIVIFYDGVNDAWNQCFSYQDVFSPIHSETSRIRNLLSKRNGLTSAILEPFYLVLNRVNQNTATLFTKTNVPMKMNIRAPLRNIWSKTGILYTYSLRVTALSSRRYSSQIFIQLN